MYLVACLISSVYAASLRGLQLDFHYMPQLLVQSGTKCFGLMFDAGSSGTRVYVYNWDCRQTQTLSYINLEEQAPERKVKPGISAYSENVEGLTEYFKQFLDFANANVPAEMRKYTPIMLGATAGMRMLPQDKQDAIMAKIRNIFSKSGYLFHNSQWARILTGQEEGAYLWLSVNYMLKQLGPNTPETALTIDLGGASTQIAFKSKPPLEENEMSLVIPNFNNYEIYSISHLYYGCDQAQLKVDAQLGPQNPCYFKGYSKDNLVGVGDINQCRQAIRKYLNNDPQNCKFKSCGINGSFQPEIEPQQIYGLSAVQSAAELFNLTSYTLQELFDESVKFCSLTWDEVMAIPEYRDNPYTPTNYFLVLYVYELLGYGYRIPASAVIESPDLIGGLTPTWTLAAMFYQVGQIDCRHDSPICSSVMLSQL